MSGRWRLAGGGVIAQAEVAEVRKVVEVTEVVKVRKVAKVTKMVVVAAGVREGENFETEESKVELCNHWKLEGNLEIE